MKSICFFSSYYEDDLLPGYVKYYLQELKRHFTEVVLMTTEKSMPDKDIAFLRENNLTLLLVQNEGYDFGMWYKAFQKYGITGYERIGFVNDSCILFGSLDGFFQWVEKENPDFAGFTDSYLLGYHLQSYFLVINKNALPLVHSYLMKKGIVKNINDVIKIYETGLSKHLKENGMKIQAMYNVPEKGEYNYALLQAKSLIKKGFPLIKKKIITRMYTSERWWSMVVIGFDPFPGHYIKLIKKQDHVRTDIFKELMDKKNLMERIKFNIVGGLASVSGVLSNKRKIVKD